MPESKTDPAIEPKPSSHRSVRTRIIAGAIGTLVGVCGTLAVHHEQEQDKQIQAFLEELNEQEHQVDRLADIAAGLSGSSAEVVRGDNLRSVEDLPGYGHEVSDNQRAQMRDATVKLVTNTTGADWVDNCTALVFTTESRTLALTARHCINVESAKGGSPSVEALDVTRFLLYPYGIRLPGTAPDSAPVINTSRAVTALNNDLAVLELVPGPATDSLRPITNLKETIENKTLPLPGESTVVFSLPQAAEGELLTGEGIYLGSIPDSANPATTIHYVGLRNANTPKSDACNFGASGSSAMTASGSLLGPLSFRNNTGYQPGSATNYGDDLKESTEYRLAVEQALGLDLSSFDTLCGYSSVPTNEFNALLQTVQQPNPGELPDNTP